MNGKKPNPFSGAAENAATIQRIRRRSAVPDVQPTERALQPLLDALFDDRAAVAAALRLVDAYRAHRQQEQGRPGARPGRSSEELRDWFVGYARRIFRSTEWWRAGEIKACNAGEIDEAVDDELVAKIARVERAMERSECASEQRKLGYLLKHQRKQLRKQQLIRKGNATPGAPRRAAVQPLADQYQHELKFIQVIAEMAHAPLPSDIRNKLFANPGAYMPGASMTNRQGEKIPERLRVVEEIARKVRKARLDPKNAPERGPESSRAIEIGRRLKNGESIKSIARAIPCDIKTVKRYRDILSGELSGSTGGELIPEP